jgi:peptidoglycan/LPS O-acetylase OafA/YrhL
MSDRADKHWPQLDGLRGIAVLLVMVYHFIDLLAPSYRPPGGAAEWCWAIAGAGWVGVDLFFVLSGFLITGILFDTRDGGRYFFSFYLRRVLRIFPLYYGILAVLLLVVPLVRVPESAGYQVLLERQGWYWAYLTNWLIAGQGDFGAVPAGYFWSLAVEEQFYLVWPFFVLWMKRETLLRLCTALVVASPIVRLVLLACGTSPAALYVMTCTHLEPLAVGAALALALRGPRGEVGLSRWLHAGAWSSAGLLLVLFLTCGQLKFWDSRVAGVGTTLLALAFGGWLHHLRVAPPIAWSRRLCEWAALRSCGRLSYALYLFHLPVAVAVRKLVFDPAPALEAGGFVVPLGGYVVLAGGLSWLAALASWHLFEKHFLRLKRLCPARSQEVLAVPLAA